MALLACLPQAANAGGAQPPAAPSAKPAKPAAKAPAPKPKRRQPAPQPAPPPAAASPAQLEAAERVFYGVHQCEFGQSVDVALDPQWPGYVNVSFGKARYLMLPVLSTTGAIRLEDVKGAALMVQITAKSMLLDVKAGRRLVDECVSDKHREAALAAQLSAAAASAAAVEATAGAAQSAAGSASDSAAPGASAPASASGP